MFNIELYQRYNKLQRDGCKKILDEFSPIFKWRPDGKDSLLDIGCGPGDVTNDVIVPFLPKNFSRLVCADISEKALNTARTKVQSQKAAFEILDVGSPLNESVWTTRFDHITLFYCLHWIQSTAGNA